MYENTKQLIREINGNCIRADLACRTGDRPTELKQNLYAVGNIVVLLLGGLDGRIDEETAKTYAQSLENSVHKIKRMIDEGVK